MIKEYIINILLWLDRGINVILGGGDSRESVSSRWGRLQNKTWLAKWGCKILNYLDPGHCDKAIEPDVDHQREI